MQMYRLIDGGKAWQVPKQVISLHLQYICSGYKCYSFLGEIDERVHTCPFVTTAEKYFSSYRTLIYTTRREFGGQSNAIEYLIMDIKYWFGKSFEVKYLASPMKEIRVRHDASLNFVQNESKDGQIVVHLSYKQFCKVSLSSSGRKPLQISFRN